MPCVAAQSAHAIAGARALRCVLLLACMAASRSFVNLTTPSAVQMLRKLLFLAAFLASVAGQQSFEQQTEAACEASALAHFQQCCATHDCTANGDMFCEQQAYVFKQNCVRGR